MSYWRGRLLVVLAVAGLSAGLAHGAETAPSAEPTRGRMLYENHCTTCHETAVHLRAKRAQDRKVLEGWVRRWHKVLSLEWSEGDMLAVTDHLARTYYDFEERR